MLLYVGQYSMIVANTCENITSLAEVTKRKCRVMKTKTEKVFFPHLRKTHCPLLQLKCTKYSHWMGVRCEYNLKLISMYIAEVKRSA